MGMLIIGDSMYYINVFFLFSILGHAIESIFYAIGSGESGFLYGFWTPIYGIGTCIIIGCYQFIKDKITKQKWKQTLIIFLIGFFLLTLTELLGGILIEKIFGKVFWDYSNFPLHIGHYISVEMAFIWGIASVFLIYFIKPITDKIVKKIPSFVTWILIILFLIDFLLTLYNKL